MSRPLLALLLCTLSVLPTQLMASNIAGGDAQRDLRILKRALVELHPGAFRRITPAVLDAQFEAASALVAQGTDRGTMFLLASRLAAAIRCGHTWTNPLNQSQAVVDELFARADKLPVTVRRVAGRLLVTGSTLAGLPAGSELLAIDGREPGAMATELLPYLRADGDADGKRLAQLDHDENGGALDRLWPLLHPPRAGRYLLRVRDARGVREIEAPATTIGARDAALALQGVHPPGTDWQLAIEGDSAMMTLPTFSFWNGAFDWQAWLEDAFTRLRERHIAFLVIDIRRNEGGSDAVGKRLLAHLLRAPYTQPPGRVEYAYERAPYVLARYLDTWDFGFFDRTGKVVRGPGRNWLAIAQPTAETITPVALPFAGRTLVLVGPQNSSAGFLFARDLKASAAATLLGQPTAGSQRGLNGGELAWVTLPGSGVAVDIPLASEFHDDLPDAGVAPDIAVAPAFADAQAGIDTELLAARRVIAAWHAPAPAAR